MMKKSIVLLTVSILTLGVSVEAELLLYEGFDYSAGSLDQQGTAGDGWTGTWSGANYTVVTNNLTMPNLPFAATGGSIIGNNGANRNCNEIDFSQEGTYFISYIVRRTGWGASDGGGEWADFALRSSSWDYIAAGGISSSETFETRYLGATQSDGDAATTNLYFIVIKVVTHETDPDEIYLKAYTAESTIEIQETSNWTVSGGTAASGLVASKVTLYVGTDNDDDGLFQASYDEIRIGTTWEDVVPNTDPDDLIAYEAFDYEEGSLNGKGDSTDGWTGSWASSANYNVVSNSLEMPNLPFNTVGGSIIGQNTANRHYAGIDMSEDAVYYTSFIVQRSGWGAEDGAGEYSLFYWRNTAYQRAGQAGINSAETFSAKIEGDSSESAAGDASGSDPYFLVAKIVAHASGADEIYLQAYSASDQIDLDEVNEWMIAGEMTGESDLFSNMITLWSGADDDEDGYFESAFDEIRIGRTWASVVPSEVAVPAVIVSLSSVSTNVFEMTVASSNPELSYLKKTSDLVGGSWTSVVHSIDGNEPFVETNLMYSATSNGNYVIYIKEDESAAFYKVETQQP